MFTNSYWNRLNLEAVVAKSSRQQQRARTHSSSQHLNIARSCLAVWRKGWRNLCYTSSSFTNIFTSTGWSCSAGLPKWSAFVRSHRRHRNDAIYSVVLF